MKQCVLKRFTEDRVRVETENLIDINKRLIFF